MAKCLYDASGNMTIQTLESVVPPQIIGQPVKQIVAPGELASFSVVISDASGVTFQWKFNGTDIPGATGDSLLLTKTIVKADEGQYSVVVTNSNGSVTSVPAELMLDSDDDGLPDNWEILNFGGELTSQRSEGDPDHDGVSNLDEFLDGTNPNSSTSLRPRLIIYCADGGSVTVVPMKLSYDLGETVTLTPTAFAPSVFAGWAGDLNTTSNPAPLTMNANKTVRARFASSIPPPPGIVAFWPGETDATDIIGGHNGTFFKGTTATTPSVTPSGKVGAAFSFDGTVHVEVPDSAELKPASITVEGWVFPRLFAAEHQTIIARGNSTPGDAAWLLGLGGILGGGGAAGEQPFFRTSPSDDLVSPTVIPLNQWTHLAATFDGTTKRLYVNGVLVASRDGVSNLIYDPAGPVTIGSNGAGGTSSALFTGCVDEVAIYNRALTGNEVVDIFNADIAGKKIAVHRANRRLTP